MQFSTLVLGALASTALAVPLTERQSCSAPSNFTIESFEFFTTYGDIVGSQTTFGFEFSDLEYNENVSCSRSNTTGPVNSPTVYPCDNSNVTFIWDNLKLSIFDTYTCEDGTTGSVTATDVDVEFICRDFGNGVELCEEEPLNSPQTFSFS